MLIVLAKTTEIPKCYGLIYYLGQATPNLYSYQNPKVILSISSYLWR